MSHAIPSTPHRDSPISRAIRASTSTITFLGALIFAVACSSDTVAAPERGRPPIEPVRSVEIAGAPPLALTAGERVRLVATPRDRNGQPLVRAVEWTTSDPSIATVTGGEVVAVAPGLAMIGATTDGVRGEVGVRVAAVTPPPLPPPAPVARVTFSVSGLELETGESGLFRARAFDATGNELTDRAFAFTSSDARIVSATAADAGGLAVQSLAAGDATITVRVEGIVATLPTRVVPRPSASLLFDRVGPAGNEIFALTLDGSLPVRLNAGNVSRQPSPSPDGSRYVFAVTQNDLLTGAIQHDLYIVDRNGMNMRRLTSMAGVETSPVWSPDGTRIAFAGSLNVGEPQDIWTVNVNGGEATNLTANMPLSYEEDPAWSPDSRTIAFTSIGMLGGSNLYTVRADGSAPATPVPFSGAGAYLTSAMGVTWSPAGDRLAVSLLFEDNDRDVAIVPVTGGPVQRIRAAGVQLDPAWSPDGAHFAFATDRAVGSRIATMRSDGSALRVRAEGRNPAWIVLR